MERKLVSFKQIDSIVPHTNADSLELAIMGGWQCIVEKNKFKAGDWVIYFEIDSLIPISDRFEFLRKYCYVSKAWMPEALGVSEGFRIKSLKLRGELSQGLIIPIPDNFMTPLDEDTDLSNEFGVIKYEVPATNTGNPSYCTTQGKGIFPSFIPKTGETRIQNKASLVMDMRNELFEVTRKYHGMSITFYAKLKTEISLFEKARLFISGVFGIPIKPMYKFGVCSHNVELDVSKDESVFTTFAKSSGALAYLKKYVENNPDMPEVAIQGEICGPGIQDNHHGLDEIMVFVFNIFDIKEVRYLLPNERWTKFVEIFGDPENTLIREAAIEFIRPIGGLSINEIINLGEFKLLSGKDNEGLVWKAMESDFSFKAISNDFLLNCKD